MPLSHTKFLVAAALLCAFSGNVANAQTATPAATAPTPAATAAAPALGVARKTASGLTIIDNSFGEGPEITAQKPVLVHYTGWLYDESAPDKKGKKFDSSLDRKVPLGFFVGAKRVIAGWDEGVLGMKKGGKRTLIIPSNLGYGDNGNGSAIPPKATLIFDIEFVQFAG